MSNEINLPPLPEPIIPIGDGVSTWNKYNGAQMQAYASAAVEKDRAERGGVPDDCDVRKILLAVVPGFDGMGEEVYAKSNADVEELLGKMGEELEDWRLGIKRFSAAPQPQPVQEAPLTERVPLTNERIDEGIAKLAPQGTRYWRTEVLAFRDGVRFAEAAHNIKKD